MPVVEVAGIKIVYEEGYYPRVRPDGPVLILLIAERKHVTNLQEAMDIQSTNQGISAALHPIKVGGAGDAGRGLEPQSTQESHGCTTKGCNLGADVWHSEGEELFCFRWKSSLEAGKPEGTAISRGGRLYVDGVAIERSKGSILQPALRYVQNKIGDVSPTAGGLTSLDAWKYWYVRQSGRFIPAHELRDPARISRRRRITLADL